VTNEVKKLPDNVQYAAEVKRPVKPGIMCVQVRYGERHYLFEYEYTFASESDPKTVEKKILDLLDRIEPTDKPVPSPLGMMIPMRLGNVPEEIDSKPPGQYA
jgi:hypothetical protein